MQHIRSREHAKAGRLLGWSALSLCMCGSAAPAQVTGHASGAQATAPRGIATRPTAPPATAPISHAGPSSPLQSGHTGPGGPVQNSHHVSGGPAGVHTHSGIRANSGYDSNSAAPRPTWEMPRTNTPQWETPGYNPVQPNPVQGNPVQRSHGGAYGYGGGYYPGYYIDPLALATDEESDQGPDGQGAANQAGPASGRQAYGPAQEFGDDPNARPLARAPYSGQQPVASQPVNPGPVTDGLDHPEITLIFNDGRKPMKIHSYAVTASSIFVAEGGRQQQIPLSALDLNATIARNRAAGVDFAVPGGTR